MRVRIYKKIKLYSNYLENNITQYFLTFSRHLAVRLPRQKSARHCLVDFSSAADLKAAETRLQCIRIDGQPLIVSPAHSNDISVIDPKSQLVVERREQRAVLNRLLGCLEQVAASNPTRSVTNGVFVRDLPRNIRRQELADVLPHALEIRILLPTREDHLAGAAVELPSPADALKTRKSKVVIRGETYRPEFQRDGKHSARLAKRLVNRGISSGPARYFQRRCVTAAGDEIKLENTGDANVEAEVVNEIMNVYD